MLIESYEMVSPICKFHKQGCFYTFIYYNKKALFLTLVSCRSVCVLSLGLRQISPLGPSTGWCQLSAAFTYITPYLRSLTLRIFNTLQQYSTILCLVRFTLNR